MLSHKKSPRLDILRIHRTVQTKKKWFQPLVIGGGSSGGGNKGEASEDNHRVDPVFLDLFLFFVHTQTN